MPMNKLNFLLPILLFTSHHSVVSAQTLIDSLDQKIPGHHLKEDFRSLRTKLEASQPGLYLYIPKDSLDGIFNEMENSISGPMTSLEFFRKIAPLNKILRNLHTRIWPSALYEKATETVLPRFPLDIYWHNSQMYVLRNNSTDESVQAGAVIKTINGESAGNVFQTILDHRVRDGFNET